MQTSLSWQKAHWLLPGAGAGPHEGSSGDETNAVLTVMVLSCVNLPIKTHWSIYFKRMQLLTHILCNNELNFWNAQCLFLDTEHTHRYLTHKQFFSVNATLWKCISSYHHSTERVNKWHTQASLFSFYSIPHLPSWNPEDTCGSHRNAWHLLFQSKFNMWPLKSITTHKKKKITS